MNWLSRLKLAWSILVQKELEVDDHEVWESLSQWAGDYPIVAESEDPEALWDEYEGSLDEVGFDPYLGQYTDDC